MHYFSSCPGTSSSSKDSGTEEHIVINPKTNGALGIPDHPLFKEAKEATIRAEIRTNMASLNGDIGQNWATQWINPFMETSNGSKRILNLPALEKNSDGRYFQTAKRKTVRFSSPLTEVTPSNDNVQHRMSQLFKTATEEDLIEDNDEDNDASSLYNTSSNSDTKDSFIPIPLDEDSNLYNDVAVNMYLDYDDVFNCEEILQSKDNKGNCINVLSDKELGGHLLEEENGSDYSPEEVNYESSSDISGDSLDSSSVLAKEDCLERQSAASCDTPLCQILKDSESNMYHGSEDSLISKLQNARFGLLRLLDDDDDKLEMTDINESTTLGEVFEIFVALSKSLMSQGAKHSNQKEQTILQKEVEDLKMKNEILQRDALESSCQFRSSSSDLKKEIDKEKQKVLDLTDALKLSKEAQDNLKGNLDTRSKEIREIQSENDSMKRLMLNSILEMRNVLNDVFEEKYDKINEQCSLETFQNVSEHLYDKLQSEKLNLQKLENSFLSSSEDYRKRLSRQEQKLKILNVQYSDLLTKIQDLDNQGALKEEEINDLKHQLEKTRNILGEEMENSRSLKGSLNKAEVATEETRSQNALFEKSCKELEATIDRLEREITLSNESLVAANSLLSEKTEDLIKKQEHIKNLQKQLRDYMESVSQYELEKEFILKINGELKEKNVELKCLLDSTRAALEVKQEAVELSREKCMFLEQKINSLNDALIEKISYISKLESIKLELQNSVKAHTKIVDQIQASSSEMQDMLIFSYKELLDSIISHFSETITDDFVSQIPRAFEAATLARIPAEMSPFFARANKAVSEAVEYLVVNLKKYSKSLSTERINTKSLAELLSNKDIEIGRLKQNNSRLLTAVKCANTGVNIQKDKRRIVSEKVYKPAARRSEYHSCSACMSKTATKLKSTDPEGSKEKLKINEVSTVSDK